MPTLTPHKTIEEDIVIIGAGSAGLSAATQFASAGVHVCVIDENPRPGGVVYRGSMRTNDVHYQHLDKQTQKKIEQNKNIYESHQSHITLLNNCQVIGPLQAHNRLGLVRNSHLYQLDYKKLIIATGCYERTVQFPGWTLPGVMTLGCAQLHIKGGLVKPGSNMAIVGSGPLLPIVAKQLKLAGVNIVGVYEAAHFASFAKQIYKLALNPNLLLKGLSSLAFLKRAKIPFYYGWGINHAHGVDAIQKVTVTPYDQNWQADTTRAKTLAVDSLGVGYGFIPRTELTQLLGIEHNNHPYTGYHPVIDKAYRTSHPDIYVAGDCAGFYGAQVATESGKIAAISCLVDLEKTPIQQAKKILKPIHKRIDRYKRFQSVFHKVSNIQPGVLTLPGSDTTICRCENVSKATIDNAIQNGVRDITSLKMATRIGMGDCQGKICSPYCYEYLKTRLKKNNPEIGRLRPRFPLVPLPFTAVLPKDTIHES